MPRILRGLGSRSLPCGCLVGFYETYTNETVAILDARGQHCPDPRHALDSKLDLAFLDDHLQLPRTIPTVNR